MMEKINKRAYEEMKQTVTKLIIEKNFIELALDKACKRLESFDAMSYCPPEKHWSKEKWKEWCMKL